MNRQQKILVALITLTLCFIWGNSLMPASISGAISGWVKDVLNAILGSVDRPVMASDGVLRKIAHATEFAVLGIELTILLRKLWEKQRSVLFLCGLLVALLDETIQLFVDGCPGIVKL